MKTHVARLAAVIAALAAGWATAVAIAGPPVRTTVTVLNAKSLPGAVTFTMRVAVPLSKQAKCQGSLTLTIHVAAHAPVTQTAPLKSAGGSCAALLRVHLSGVKLGQSVPFHLSYKGKQHIHLNGTPVKITIGQAATTTTTTTTSTSSTNGTTSTSTTSTTTVTTVPVTTTTTGTTTTTTTTGGPNIDGIYNGVLTSTASTSTQTSPVSLQVSTGRAFDNGGDYPYMLFSCSDGSTTSRSWYDQTLGIYVTTTPDGGNFTGTDSASPGGGYSFTVSIHGSISVSGTGTNGSVTINETFTNTSPSPRTCTSTGTGTISQ